MPLSTREVLMVVRASDMASRVMSTLALNFGASSRAIELSAQAAAGASEEQVAAMEAAQAEAVAASKHLIGIGVATMAAGVGIVAIGVSAAKFLKTSTNAAVAYNLQAAYTLTQNDNIGASLKKVGQIGLTVGSQIGVPFDQLQGALYDIYSSMDVTDKQAQALLTSFAKVAVAGQVPITDAAKATIGIMNAYHLGADQVNKVNDVMFELVKKGVGTYEDFSGVIGRVTPSAVIAGQSMQTMGGMMAFLTRNGLTAANAGSAAARALSSMANPVFDKNLKSLGLTVKDSHGNFKTMGDMVDELSGKLKDMTAPERAAALTNLLKGAGGTIQSMRFWTEAVDNAGQLNALIQDMQGSSGQTASAYNSMASQMATKSQLLKNNFQILRIEVGEPLISAFQKLTLGLIKVVQWFNNLSPHTKELVVKIAAIVTGLTILAGILITVGGLMAVIVGIAGALEIELGPIILFIAAAIAIGAGLYYAYTHSKEFHDEVNKLAKDVEKMAKEEWPHLKAAVKDAIDFIKRMIADIPGATAAVERAMKQVADNVRHAFDNFMHAVDNVKHAAENTINALQDAWNAFFHALDNVEHAFDNIQHAWNNTWHAVGDAVRAFVNGPVAYVRARIAEFMTFWNSHFSEMAQITSKIWTTISSVVRVAWDQFYGIIKIGFAALSAFWKTSWALFFDVFDFVWKMIGPTVKFAWDLLWNIIKIGMDIISTAWNVFWDAIVLVVKTIWDTIATTLAVAWRALLDAIGIFLDLLTGHWGKAWTDAKAFVLDIWNGIIKIFNDFGKNAITFLRQAGKDLLTGLGAGFNDVIKLLQQAWTDAIKFLTDFASAALKFLEQAGSDLIQGLINGIQSMATKAVDAVKSVGKAVLKGFKDITGIGSPSKEMHQLGLFLGQGLANGILAGQSGVARAAAQLGRQATFSANMALSGSSGSQSSNPVGGASYSTAKSVTVNFHPGSVQVTGDKAGAEDFVAQLTTAIRKI
jgi:TP901 family phage tail tape measure protein